MASRSSHILAGSLFAAVCAAGCSVTSNWFFRGTPPEAAAPRVVVAPAVLENIRHAPGEPPFWEPGRTEMASCEAALWRRAHLSRLHDDLSTYAIQFMGVTQYGKRVVVLNALCPRLWEDPRYREELATSVFPGLHTGSCTIHAVCQPEASYISSFSTGTRGRR